MSDEQPPLRDRLCRLEDLAWKMRTGLGRVRDRLHSNISRDSLLRELGDLVYNTAIDLTTETHEARQQYDEEQNR